MGGFSPRSVLRRGLERPQFPDGLFPFAGVAQRRTPAVSREVSTRSLRSGGPGMTVVAALMAVFFIMQLVGQVPAALGHFRRGSLSLGRDHDRHFACRIWHSAFTRPAMITGPVAARLGEGGHSCSE